MLSKGLKSDKTELWSHIRSLCHVCWMSSQFIAATCIICILLLHIFDCQSVVKGVGDAKGPLYKRMVALIWLFGLAVGLTTFAIEFDLIVQFQTMYFCIIAVVSFLYVCFRFFISNDESDAPDDDVTQETDNDKIGEKEPDDMVPVEMDTFENDEIDLNENETEVIAEREAALCLVKFYAFCALLGGMLLLFINSYL